VLSEQLSQQTDLFAEIERNQTKLDQCQKYSQQYSTVVKDYELQLMTYKAFVESQQKSPGKRRRMLSSSDAITQEFMDLRTRYTALVTLTTQHVKYISDALQRLEEEEKVVEEEKQEHVEKVKELLGWVSTLARNTQSKATSSQTKELTDIEKAILEQQVLAEELTTKREQVSEAIKTSQIFLAKHGHKLSEKEKEQISEQLNALNKAYHDLCDGSANQLHQLQSQLAQQTEQKTLQKQQNTCHEKLEDLCSWVGQAERALVGHQGRASQQDLSALQKNQSDLKDLQDDIQNRAASFASVVKDIEGFLEENQTKLSPQEVTALREKLHQAKQQCEALQARTRVAQKELEEVVTSALQQETEKSKAAKELAENRSKIDALLDWVASVGSPGGQMEQLSGASLEKGALDTTDGHMGVNHASEKLDKQYEKMKAHHQELLSQQQNFILATQSAQAFLDQHGHNLTPEERQTLQEKLGELKEQYATSLAQSEAGLKQVQTLRDELQKFLQDHREFENWLERSEKELENMHKGGSSPEALPALLKRQGGFSEGVISKSQGF